MRLLLPGQGVQDLLGLGLVAPVRKPEVEIQGLGFQHHGQIEHLGGRLQVGFIGFQKFFGAKAAFQGLRHDGRFKGCQVLAAGRHPAVDLKEPLLVAHLHLGQFPEKVL